MKYAVSVRTLYGITDFIIFVYLLFRVCKVEPEGKCPNQTIKDCMVSLRSYTI